MPEGKGILKVDNTGVIPTSRDTINSYVFDKAANFPLNSFVFNLENQLKKKEPELYEDAKESYELTPGMTDEDFESAKNTIGVTSDAELLEELTGTKVDELGDKYGTMGDLIAPYITGDEQTQLAETTKRLGGSVNGTGHWSGKSVPGMFNNK